MSGKYSSSRYTFDPDRPQLQASDSDELASLLGSKVSSETMTSLGKFRMFACSFIATIGSLIVGYCLGFSSPALVDPALVGEEDREGGGILAGNNGWFGSSVNLGAALGGACAGIVTAKLGRKGTIMFSGLPYAFGWFLIMLPSYLDAEGNPDTVSLMLLLMGRVLSGIGLGIACGVIPIYIAEISLPKYRGFLGTCFQVTVTMGMFQVYVIGGLFIPHYYWLAFIALMLAALLVVLMLWVVDSPRSLLLEGKTDKARKSLQWLRGPGANIASELREVEKSLSDQETLTLSEFKNPVLWKPLLIVLGLMFFQQFTGINAVAFYASIIFDKSGSTFQKNYGPLVIAAVQVISTVVAALVMDRLGRRKLLVISGISMCLSVVTLGVFFCINPDLNNASATSSSSSTNTHPEAGALSLVSLIVYITGFSFGWGAIPWLVMSEILPSKARSIASGICTCFVWLCSFAVTYMFQPLTYHLNMDGTFWFFGGFCFVSVLFVLFFVPETKGKTLEEIEQHFGSSGES
eukprot:m.122538 g.122538  ORF g.122538 m.122538 type:complete len:520 (+) comp37791_c0_seq7:1845-3404(+)